MSLSNFLGSRPKPKIFICYRRFGEGAGFGGRIADKLVEHFGPYQCFRDIENIEKGTDFVESIAKATSVCELLLVVIGPDWLTLKDSHGQPKILSKNDFVRLEVGTALSRNIRVIPVLVGGAKDLTEAQLPDDLKLLARRQSHELSDNRWDYDSDQLIKSIESIGIRGRSREEREAWKRKQKMIATVVATSMVILMGFALGNYFKPFSGNKTQDPSENVSKFNAEPIAEPTAAKEVKEVKEEFTNTSPTKQNVNSESISEPTEFQENLNTNTLPRIDVSTAKKINYNREQGSIKNTLILASSLEAEAFLTLNEGILSQVFTGDAMRNYNVVFSQYRNLGIYNINILENQSFGEFNIYEEDGRLLAEVELLETWSGHTHRTLDHLCLVHQESRQLPQTVFLEKMNDSWYITSTTQLDDSPPPTTQCGQYNCYLH